MVMLRSLLNCKAWYIFHIVFAFAKASLGYSRSSSSSSSSSSSPFVVLFHELWCPPSTSYKIIIVTATIHVTSTRPQASKPKTLNLGHFQVGSYRYRSRIEGLYTL